MVPATPPPERRLAIGVATGLAALGCGVVAAYCAFLSWFAACFGDAGYPFSAPASAAGQICNSTAGHLYTLAQLGLPILVVLVLGTYAVVRAQWGLLAIGVGISVTVIVVMYMVMESLPRQCSEEQLRTLPRLQCETY